MLTFRYQAQDAGDQVVSGEIQAENVQRAIALLEEQGLAVRSIAHVAAAFEEVASRAQPTDFEMGDRRPSPDARIRDRQLKSQLSRVLSQGRRLAPAIAAYAAETRSTRRRRDLLRVCDVLERGDEDAAWDALIDLPQYWIPLLSASSSSGDVGQFLCAFLDESQRADEIRRHWRQSLAYPAIIAVVAIGVLVALSFLVIPTFREIFNDFGLELPHLTLWVLAMSRWITSEWGAVTGALIAALAAALVTANRWAPRGLRQRLSDCASIAAGRATSIAQLSRSTAELLEAGLEAPESLRVAGLAVQRLRLRKASWRLAEALEADDAAALQACRRPLTSAVVHALQSPGMAPDSRVRLLKEISSVYADRTRIRLSWTRGMIEPLAICVVGFVVGVVVLGLFLPLVSLVSNLTG